MDTITDKPGLIQQEGFIQQVAIEPDEAERLAKAIYENFMHAIAGKPIALQQMKHTHWKEQEIFPESERELYYYRISMLISGTQEDIMQMKEELEQS